MITELISNIINTTLDSFDIPFCITVNIATYIFIKYLSDIKKTLVLTTWHKRIALILISIIIGAFYCINGSDYKTILNSIILAPVSWSWIFKPICAKLKIDYNKSISS